MPHDGYANPITNDGPRLHSIIPVSELTKRVTRARSIEASDVSSAPSVARNHGWGNAQNSTTPIKAQIGLRGSRHLNCLSCARHQDLGLSIAQSLKLPQLCPTRAPDAKIHELHLV